jgi:low affinity Fe/Cu permease
MKNWLKKVFAKLFQRKVSVKGHSRFQEFLDVVDEKDAVYPVVREAVELCDESMDNIELRRTQVERAAMLAKAAEDTACYAELDDEEVEFLKNIKDRCLAVARDLGNTKQQMLGFGSAVAHLVDMEEEAARAVSDMKDAEERQAMFGKDMYLLRDEKENLEDERERLLYLIGFMYRFTKVAVGVFVAASVGAVLMYLFMGTGFLVNVTVTDILVIVTVMFVAAVLITVMLMRIRKKLDHSLKMNFKKQHKAVGMINTKTVAYAQYTGSLNYFRVKYKVENAAALERNIAECQRYKHTVKRYDGLRSIMKQTEDELLNFLRIHDIPISMTTEHYSLNTDVDEYRKKHERIMYDKSTVEKSVESIDARQEEIFSRLTELAGGEGGPFVGAVMIAYNNRVAAKIGGAEK